MQLQYFNINDSPEELKKRFRELAKEYHPDKQGGSVETMQNINVEYDYVINNRFDKPHEEFDSNFDVVLNDIMEIINRNPSEYVVDTIMGRFYVRRMRKKIRTGRRKRRKDRR